MDKQGKNSVNTPTSRPAENQQGGSQTKSQSPTASVRDSVASQVNKIISK